MADDMNSIYSVNIDNLMNTLMSKNEKSIVFFKGFESDFFEILVNKGIPSLCEGAAYINEDSSINVIGLKEESRSLLLKYLQMSSGNIVWGYYEELLMLCSSLTNIDSLVDANIVVVSNNLFDRSYPLNLDSDILNRLYEYVNGEETENKELEDYLDFYSDIISYSGDLFGVVYNEREHDYAFERVNFYDSTYRWNHSKSIESSNVISELNLFEFKNNLQRGEVLNELKLVMEYEKDAKEITPIVFIMDSLNMRWGIEFKERFSDLDVADDNKYLPVLKKYWGADKEFRKIHFYKNPEESNETFEISQGHIISDIIEQSEKVINNDDNFRDMFITAPTGAGKSLLFQIPAIHLANEHEAVTIVITPLIALMRDQVEQLQSERNVHIATFLNSEISYQEREERLSRIRNGELSIIYMAPELFLSTPIENIIGPNRRLGLLVIDEAHIVTSWGRDFRADYWFLGGYIEKIRKNKDKDKQFPIVCLTATAVYMGTEDTVNDTINTLALNTPKIYLGNVRRTNIAFDITVVDKKQINGGIEEFKINRAHERVLGFLETNLKTLVYFPFTTQIENLNSQFIGNERHSIGRYYGRLDKELKLASQEKFKSGEQSVMLCTKAFGMGIDISDIEIVYHFAPTGNLSDYVQEVGRLARKRDITGIAAADFLASDLKYSRTLSGLSSIRQYQLKEIMRKLYSIYSKNRRRNMLISPDTFSYLFDDDSVENKVKTALLLLEKDLNKNFNVLVVRPKSIFTKNFVNVPNEIEEEFLLKYSEYANSVDDYTKRVLPGGYRSSDVVISNSGTIYEVNMSEIWSNYFSDITFPDFKRRFFMGELFKFTDENAKLSPRFKITVNYKNDYEETKELLKKYTDKLVSVFSKLKRQNKFFSKKEFKSLFDSTFSELMDTRDLSDILLNMFVADTSNNVGFNQNNDHYKFITLRKSQTNPMDVEYRVMNNNFTTMGSYLTRQMSQCSPSGDSHKYAAYIAIERGGRKTDILNLAILLELFKLATYEVIGGKNMEIFVRINEPEKIKYLSNGNYRNQVLADTEKKRKKSQEVLFHFMMSNLDDEQRWDVIENYFIGNEDYVETILGIS